MPEAVVEKEICGLCGVEKRPGAVYCYHCGGSLSDSGPLSAPPIPMPGDTPLIPSDVSEPIQVPEALDEPEMPTPVAGKQRRRKRKFKPKVVEVEWREPDSIGISFIAWSSVLLLLCVLIVAAAMYLR